MNSNTKVRTPNPAQTAPLRSQHSFASRNLLHFIQTVQFLPVGWGISLVVKSFAFHEAWAESHVFVRLRSCAASASQHSLRGSLNNPLSSVFNCRGNHQPAEIFFFFPFILRAAASQYALSSRVHLALSMCASAVTLKRARLISFNVCAC